MSPIFVVALTLNTFMLGVWTEEIRSGSAKRVSYFWAGINLAMVLSLLVTADYA